MLQREYQIRAAAMYADAGNRMRNSGDWDKQDAQYKQQIADKQKALDDAKQKLEDIQEERPQSRRPRLSPRTVNNCSLQKHERRSFTPALFLFMHIRSRRDGRIRPSREGEAPPARGFPFSLAKHHRARSRRICFR